VHRILAPQGELQLVAGRLGSAVSRQKPVNALQGPGQMNKRRTKKVVDSAKEAEKPPSPYKPTPAEAETLKAYRAGRAKSGPRLKVTASAVKIDHPDPVFGHLSLLKAVGSTDSDFLEGLKKQLVNAGSHGSAADEDGINFMLSVVKGVEPRDQIEAMLAAQMAAVHMASMTFARRLGHVETIPQQDSASNAFNKLTRTFAAQVEALKRYRSGGEQKMTVQHVHVAEGGQAIVGNVSASAEGVGARKKVGDQPHAQLTYAPGVAMPRQIEAERATVPSSSHSGS
jgi:hypothetical protein